MLFCWYH